MLQIKRLASVSLGVSALMLAGCGGTTTTIPAAASHGTTSSSAAQGSAPATQGGSATNGCALITEAEATALVGSDPGPGTNTGSDTTTSCTYGGAVTVSVDHGGTRMGFADLRSVAQGQMGFQDVTGVGDAACLAIIGGSAFMYILRGSDLVQIIIQSGFSRATVSADALTTQGKAVVARL